MAKELQQTEEACSEKEPKQQKPKLAIAGVIGKKVCPFSHPNPSSPLQF